jgi:hypothetical protein
MVPALVVMVKVPEYDVAVTTVISSLTNEVSCWPAVTSIVRLPPAIAPPDAFWSVSVNVPADPAMSATPVFVLELTDTGSETDRDVTVVALFALRANSGCEKRASTATLPLENTFAKPPLNGALLCVLIVVEPPAGIKKETLGSTTDVDMRVLLFAKKSAIPWTAPLDVLRIVTAVSQSPPPVTNATGFTTGPICERATPPANCVV